MFSKTKVAFRKSSWFDRNKTWFISTVVVVVLFCLIWSQEDAFSAFSYVCMPVEDSAIPRDHDPDETTFYDDPDLTYTIDKPMRNWDEKRMEWLRLHPAFKAGVERRLLILTGSQPKPCKKPDGDHLTLRCFKNKVDYARIQGINIFYSDSYLNPEMKGCWIKISLIRAAMLAHPEAEWIWWVDSDAIFTDMDFKLPLERYVQQNMVVHGWPASLEKKSWVAINAGVFLIRNCQWSMEFLDAWASMGPQNPDFKKWGEIQSKFLTEKPFQESDDQGALVYFLLKEKQKWGRMIYVENEYYFHGYWAEIVDRYDEISKRYAEVEKETAKLRRRHSEAVRGTYGEIWKNLVQENGDLKSWRRPFITHFTGCKHCTGEHDVKYKGSDCWEGMERALNFADNQVLRTMGFTHEDLRNRSVSPLPFDFPYSN